VPFPGNPAECLVLHPDLSHWTGRGRKQKWVEQLLSGGRKLDDWRIKKSGIAPFHACQNISQYRIMPAAGQGAVRRGARNQVGGQPKTGLFASKGSISTIAYQPMGGATFPTGRSVSPLYRKPHLDGALKPA
jgi:hypothetical protein